MMPDVRERPSYIDIIVSKGDQGDEFKQNEKLAWFGIIEVNTLTCSTDSFYISYLAMITVSSLI